MQRKVLRRIGQISVLIYVSLLIFAVGLFISSFTTTFLSLIDPIALPLFMGGILGFFFLSRLTLGTNRWLDNIPLWFAFDGGWCAGIIAGVGITAGKWFFVTYIFGTAAYLVLPQLARTSVDRLFTVDVKLPS